MVFVCRSERFLNFDFSPTLKSFNVVNGFWTCCGEFDSASKKIFSAHCSGSLPTKALDFSIIENSCVIQNTMEYKMT